MNTEYPYIFEKTSKKHHCPKCNKIRFVRYIDTQTKEYLPKEYGRCDREVNCGYFLNPYKDGYVNDLSEHSIKAFKSNKVQNPVNTPRRFYIPSQVLNQTLKGYEYNVMIQNLLSNSPFPFEINDIEKIIALYYLGTIQKGNYKGAITFPFIDIQGNVRTIQAKQFDENNHTINTHFLHAMIEKQQLNNNLPLPKWLEDYKKNDKKVSCLFGEHLLKKYPDNPIALVEAPKTALYGTLYFGFPENPNNLLWLAVYNQSSLNLEKCKALKGRHVYLFSDLSKEGKVFDSWNNKAIQIQKELQNTYFTSSDLLEKLASNHDKEKGKDIADYLIHIDWKKFRSQPIQSSLLKEDKDNTTLVAPLNTYKINKPNDFFSNLQEQKKPLIMNSFRKWNDDIEDLEQFFENNPIPKKAIQLNSSDTINDGALFVKSHLATIKANNGIPTFLPYLQRLKDFKQLLISNHKPS